ncbi:MAG: FtsW/RodA/SpoVE family cell cycle protein [Lachnospiraceae bacterium]|nr:FtsW/RodA/SpoVE family cell cycle protein [Lachnospiraceae bacterium]
MEAFGNLNAVAVFHSIVVGLSKYIIIILFAIYTWHCFTVFIGKNMERKEEIYKRQKRIMFTIHFICSLVLFLNSLSMQIVGFYVAQVVFLVVVDKSYSYVYKNLSKLVMNNMLMLLTIGFLMIERLNPEYAVRQMFFAAIISFIGLFIPWIIEKFPYFDRFGWVYAVLGMMLLALVFVIGVEINGSKNWISVGGFAMQPSEFVKIIFVFFVAALLAQSTKFYDVVKVSIVAAVHVLILVAEKDLGAALIYFITYVIVLYVSSENVMYLIAAAAGGTVASVVAWKFFSHVQVRVLAWRDPWSTIDNEGYQVARSLFAIGTGGWFGMGLGEGMPSSIPVASSDFIFSAICEELGVIFAICLILVEVSCFVLFVNIALKMKRRFYKLTALGLAVEYIFQVFLTIGGVTKFIPSTGVTLPLVSYGGSSVISTIVLFCIIQGMYVLNFEEEPDGTEEDAKGTRRRKSRARKRGQTETAQDSRRKN